MILNKSLDLSLFRLPNQLIPSKPKQIDLKLTPNLRGFLRKPISKRRRLKKRILSVRKIRRTEAVTHEYK